MGYKMTYKNAKYKYNITKLIFVFHICLFVSLALQPSAGYGLLVTRGFVITHNDVLQSVGLLWTSDQQMKDAFNIFWASAKQVLWSLYIKGDWPLILNIKNCVATAVSSKWSRTSSSVKYTVMY
jgi:hypothetical protein